jgi:hypothetical protein
MLRFLLDEHISPDVCSIVRSRRSSIGIESIHEWRDGSLRGKDDDYVLRVAAESGYALVTYDLRTLPPLLREWAARGQRHQGVVFIDELTCRSQDAAGIATALIRVWDGMSDFDWTDRVAFVAKSERP